MYYLFEPYIDSIGYEAWLVPNIVEVQNAWESGTDFDEHGEIEYSALNKAADIAEECIVIRADWGNDLEYQKAAAFFLKKGPNWIDDLLKKVVPADRDKARQIIKQQLEEA
jgi:hypothetical protein